MKNIRGRYLAVIVGCAIYTAVLNASFTLTPLIFAAVLEDSISFSISTATMFWTSRMLVNALTAPFAASLYLKVNSKVYLLFLGFLCAICYAPMVFYTKQIFWIASSVPLGICNAGQVLILSSTINRWFAKGSSTILGICNAFAGIAAALCSLIFSDCINKYGWRTTTLGMAGIIFVLIWFSAYILIPVTPESVGLKRFGSDSENRHEQTSKKRTSSAAGTALLYGIILIMILNGTVINGISNHMPAYAGSLGHSLYVGAMLTSILSFVRVIMNLGLGVLCDRKGVWPVLTGTYGVIGICFLFPIFLESSVFSLAIASVGIGISYCMFAIFLPILTELYFPHQYEKAFGQLNMLINLFGTGFILILGKIYESRIGYSLAFYLAVLLCLIAGSISFSITIYYAKKNRLRLESGGKHEEKAF